MIILVIASFVAIFAVGGDFLHHQPQQEGRRDLKP
jgi:hypothetical protein